KSPWGLPQRTGGSWLLLWGAQRPEVRLQHRLEHSRSEAQTAPISRFPWTLESSKHWETRFWSQQRLLKQHSPAPQVALELHFLKFEWRTSSFKSVRCWAGRTSWSFTSLARETTKSVPLSSLAMISMVALTLQEPT